MTNNPMLKPIAGETYQIYWENLHKQPDKVLEYAGDNAIVETVIINSVGQTVSFTLTADMSPSYCKA